MPCLTEEKTSSQSPASDSCVGGGESAAHSASTAATADAMRSSYCRPDVGL